MNRPYIFCHMLTSLDGKIVGNYMETPEGAAAIDVFNHITFGEGRYYRHQGWLSGRVTTDDNFTFYKKPALDDPAPDVPEGDFIRLAPEPMYYVSIDPSGRLAWEKNTLEYAGATAYVLEVLTEKAGRDYRAFLRKRAIPYIIAGKEELDYGLLLEKLKEQFGIELLMLGGGGVLNWSFLQAGLCDELSVVMAAAADGSPDTPTLFEARAGLTEDRAVRFELQHVEVKEKGSLWMRYLVRKDCQMARENGK